MQKFYHPDELPAEISMVNCSENTIANDSSKKVGKMQSNKQELATKKKQTGNKFKNYFLHLDLFREQFLIRLDYEGNYRHRTALGSIFSIVMLFLLILYTA